MMSLTLARRVGRVKVEQDKVICTRRDRRGQFLQLSVRERERDGDGEMGRGGANGFISM